VAAAAAGRLTRQAEVLSQSYLAAKEDRLMLWFIGALLIVCWVIGLAFKVTTGVIHLALIAGLILFVLGFFKGRDTTVAP
jgi:Flp pilus assembly protein TadB